MTHESVEQRRDARATRGPLGPWSLLASTLPRLPPRRLVRVSAGSPVDLDDLRGSSLDGEVLDSATRRILALTEELEKLRDEKAPATRFDVRVTPLPWTGNPRRVLSKEPA